VAIVASGNLSDRPFGRTLVATGDNEKAAAFVANRGTVRFSELRSRLGDVSSSTLAARLTDLEEARLIVRTVYPETPPRVEYSLTPRGREFCTILTDFLRRGRK
jgi:DNA-binding HxlR family transcriptional regulator